MVLLTYLLFKEQLAHQVSTWTEDHSRTSPPTEDVLSSTTLWTDRHPLICLEQHRCQSTNTAHQKYNCAVQQQSLADVI